MKISLITTVKNEEKTISQFLESVSAQSRIPDEFIIVDADSTDNTAKLIQSYFSSQKKFTGVYIRKKGNRSIGRNSAIERAGSEIIACSDVGCTLDPLWLENITEPFSNKTIDVVAGFYKPTYESIFGKSLAAYTSVMEDTLDEKNFLPSSRSIAFRKKAWKEAGRYPEFLDYCEDLVFARQLRKRQLKSTTRKDAIVYWPQRKNIVEAAKQFFNYAVGDGMAFYFRPQTPLLFVRYIVAFIFLLCAVISQNVMVYLVILLSFIAYVMWSIQKNYRYVQNNKALYYLPLLQFTSDIAVLSGTIIGVVKRIWVTQNKQ